MLSNLVALRRTALALLALAAVSPFSITSVHAADKVWVDDTLPAGAQISGDETWKWVSAGPAPLSGKVAHQSALKSGKHRHSFDNATSKLAIGTGDKLFAYVYLDPANPPRQLMLQWSDGTWEHRAYWGENLIDVGTDGTKSRRHMGALPQAGAWVRLEVPASSVGLEGRTVKGMSFMQYDGRATWDKAGKSSTDPTPYSGSAIPVPGTFEAENFDEGGQGVAYVDNVKGNSGGLYRTSTRVDIIESPDSLGGGYVINNFQTGEWLAYTINVAKTARYDIDLRVSSTFSTSAFHVSVDGVNVTGKVTVPNTGDWGAFQWVGKNNVQLTAGKHVLKVVSDKQYFNLNSIRITETPPSPPGGGGGGSVPPPAPGSVQWSCDFPTSATNCGFFEQAKVAGRATVVSGGRTGGTAVRLHTQPGDNNVAGSGDHERNDLTLTQNSTDCHEGRVHWWGHSIKFPSDYVQPPMSTASSWNFGIVFDFHNSNPGGGQANFQLNAMPATAISPDRPTGLSFQVAYGNQSSPTTETTAIGAITKNVWYDFVYHIKWSSGTDGYIDAWVNGTKRLTYRGRTLYAGQGCYLKLANYHTAFGQPSSVIHSRIVRGTTPAAVSLTPLEGVTF